MPKLDIKNKNWVKKEGGGGTIRENFRPKQPKLRNYDTVFGDKTTSHNDASCRRQLFGLTTYCRKRQALPSTNQSTYTAYVLWIPCLPEAGVCDHIL